MRMSDYYLNATEMCAAVGLSNAQRRAYFSRIRRHVEVHAVFEGSWVSWVPFQDGVFLSEVLNLFEHMKALLSQGPIGLPREENYLLRRHRTKLR